MKQNTKNTTKKVTSTKSKVLDLDARRSALCASIPYTQNDFKNSLLLVSLFVNGFLLTAWLTAQVSSDFAYTIALSIIQ